MADPRGVIRLTDSGEEDVRLQDIRAGDRFRVDVGKGEQRGLFDKPKVYTAASDAVLSDGEWFVDLQRSRPA